MSAKKGCVRLYSNKGDGEPGAVVKETTIDADRSPPLYAIMRGMDSEPAGTFRVFRLDSVGVDAGTPFATYVEIDETTEGILYL